MPSCKLKTGYGLSLLIVVAVFVMNVCIKRVLSHRWCGAVRTVATALGLLFLSFALVLFTRTYRLLFRLSLLVVRSLIFKCFVTDFVQFMYIIFLIAITLVSLVIRNNCIRIENRK